MRMRPYPAVAGAVVLEATMAEWRAVRRRLDVMRDGLAHEVVPAGDAPGLVASPPVTLVEALQIVGLIADPRRQAELFEQVRQAQALVEAIAAVEAIGPPVPPNSDRTPA